MSVCELNLYQKRLLNLQTRVAPAEITAAARRREVRRGGGGRRGRLRLRRRRLPLLHAPRLRLRWQLLLLARLHLQAGGGRRPRRRVEQAALGRRVGGGRAAAGRGGRGGGGGGRLRRSQAHQAPADPQHDNVNSFLVVLGPEENCGKTCCEVLKFAKKRSQSAVSEKKGDEELKFGIGFFV